MTHDGSLTKDIETVRGALKHRQRGSGSTRNTEPALSALDRIERVVEAAREHRCTSEAKGRGKAIQPVPLVPSTMPWRPSMGESPNANGSATT